MRNLWLKIFLAMFACSALSAQTTAWRPWLAVENVSQPTMTIYSPKGKNTGAAVVVFPGGGYEILAIDLQGTEICDWLNSHGINAVLVKYREPHSGQYIDHNHN